MAHEPQDQIPLDDALEVVLEHLTVARLQPGDVLVLRHPGSLSMEAYERSAELLGGLFPDHEWIILQDGMELEVLRPEDVDTADRSSVG